jgi:hypothetical protein
MASILGLRYVIMMNCKRKNKETISYHALGTKNFSLLAVV